jgi:hypothetical protein
MNQPLHGKSINFTYFVILFLAACPAHQSAAALCRDSTLWPVQITRFLAMYPGTIIPLRSKHYPTIFLFAFLAPCPAHQSAAALCRDSTLWPVQITRFLAMYPGNYHPSSVQTLSNNFSLRLSSCMSSPSVRCSPLSWQYSVTRTNHKVPRYVPRELSSLFGPNTIQHFVFKHLHRLTTSK